jgi:phosphatidate cytidylyltransferase
MLPVRVATAIVGVPAVIALIWWGGAGYSVAVGVILAVAALEFYAAVAPAAPLPGEAGPASRTAGNPTLAENPVAALARRPLPRLLNQRPAGLLGAALIALLVAGAHQDANWWTGALALAAVLPALWIVARGQTETGLTEWLAIVGGVLYVGWLGSYLIPLRQLADDGQWVFLAVFAAFANDTGAYFVGTAVGRTPLARRIGPSKTVEDPSGGPACSAAACRFCFAFDLDRHRGTIPAILVPSRPNWATSWNSLLKRSTGVKDASVLVPGHGGVLDRLDSLLFVVPMGHYAIWDPIAESAILIREVSGEIFAVLVAALAPYWRPVAAATTAMTTRLCPSRESTSDDRRLAWPEIISALNRKRPASSLRLKAR